MSIETAPHPTPYTASGHQLVLEIYVTSIERSVDFYKSLGFNLDWKYPSLFGQLSWEQCLLFVKQSKEGETNRTGTPGNIRIMVPDVDGKYEECKRLGYTIQQEIGDRKYVLRDFIVMDPDGFGVRFGSYLKGRGRKEQLNGPPKEDLPS